MDEPNQGPPLPDQDHTVATAGTSFATNSDNLARISSADMQASTSASYSGTTPATTDTGASTHNPVDVRQVANMTRPSDLSNPIDVLRERTLSATSFFSPTASSTNISRTGPPPPIVTITGPRPHDATQGQPGPEPSRKRSRTDLGQDNLSVPPRQDQNIPPSGHPIREDARPIWRQARNALTSFVKTKARADHLVCLADAQTIPGWALGIDRLPPFLAPPSQVCLEIRRDHASSLLRHYADELHTRAEQDAKRGDALVSTFRHILQDDQEACNSACELLNSLVSKDRSDIRTTLHKREADQLPLSDDVISSCLTTHAIPKNITPQQDFRQRSERRDPQDPRSGPRAPAPTQGPNVQQRNPSLQQRRPRQRSTSPRTRRQAAQPAPPRGGLRQRPTSPRPRRNNVNNLTPREEALIRAFRM
jgi:hypothetical protein